MHVEALWSQLGLKILDNSITACIVLSLNFFTYMPIAVCPAIRPGSYIIITFWTNKKLNKTFSPQFNYIDIDIRIIPFYNQKNKHHQSAKLHRVQFPKWYVIHQHHSLHNVCKVTTRCDETQVRPWIGSMVQPFSIHTYNLLILLLWIHIWYCVTVSFIPTVYNIHTIRTCISTACLYTKTNT